MYDFYYFALLPEKADKSSLGFTVTLVDDEPLFMETMKDYLASMNIRDIECYSSGEEFLAALKKGDKRFIICDFDFGSEKRMNGGEVLQAVKKVDPSLPFLMLSAQDKLAVALDMLKKGALDYVIKGNESSYATVLTSLLKTNEIYRLKKDKKDFATLGIVGLALFSLLLALSFYYR
jgi:DNA-binding NtrC family response regulator